MAKTSLNANQMRRALRTLRDAGKVFMKTNLAEPGAALYYTQHLVGQRCSVSTLQGYAEASGCAGQSA